MLSILAFSVVAVSFTYQDALAHTPLIDQSFTPSPFISYDIGVGVRAQEFTPTASTIVGYDLKFSDTVGSGDVMVNGTLWVNSVGPALNFVTSIPNQLVTRTGMPQVVHFDFAAPVAITPGGSYWIEPNCFGCGLKWQSQVSPVEYTGGDSYRDGVITDTDFWFIEYASAAGPDVTNPTVAFDTTPAFLAGNALVTGIAGDNLAVTSVSFNVTLAAVSQCDGSATDTGTDFSTWEFFLNGGTCSGALTSGVTYNLIATSEDAAANTSTPASFFIYNGWERCFSFSYWKQFRYSCTKQFCIYRYFK